MIVADASVFIDLIFKYNAERSGMPQVIKMPILLERALKAIKSPEIKKEIEK